MTGNKHIRKACEKKRQLYGAPAQIQNAPRIKKIKKEQPRVDVNKTLEERLRDSAQHNSSVCDTEGPSRFCRNRGESREEEIISAGKKSKDDGTISEN